MSITASCPVVEPYGACLIGMIGGLIFIATSSWLKKLQIDDPLDASPVHFFCGIWGLLAVGIFATKAGVESVYEGRHGLQLSQ